MSDTVLLALIATIPPTLMALGALMAAIKANHKVEDLHVAVNSRLTELLDTTRKAAEAKGHLAGVESLGAEPVRADKRPKPMMDL